MNDFELRIAIKDTQEAIERFSALERHKVYVELEMHHSKLLKAQLERARCFAEVEAADPIENEASDNDGWIKLNSRECPVPPETIVIVKLKDGYIYNPSIASLLDWENDEADWSIVEYKVVEKESSKNEASDNDGWVKWHGEECPVDPNTLVLVKTLGGGDPITPVRAGIYTWYHNNNSFDIVEYKVVEKENSAE